MTAAPHCATCVADPLATLPQPSRRLPHMHRSPLAAPPPPGFSSTTLAAQPFCLPHPYCSALAGPLVFPPRSSQPSVRHDRSTTLHHPHRSPPSCALQPSVTLACPLLCRFPAATTASQPPRLHPPFQPRGCHHCPAPYPPEQPRSCYSCLAHPPAARPTRSPLACHHHSRPTATCSPWLSPSIAATIPVQPP